MLENLSLPWEGVKISLGKRRVEGRVSSSRARRILWLRNNHFHAYFKLCHLDIFWGVELEKEWSLSVWCCFVGLFPSKAFPWKPGLVCNKPACSWLWAIPDQCNNAWATFPAMVMKMGWVAGWHFCPSGIRVLGAPLPFQKWLWGQDCQEAARESGLVLSLDWLANPRGWDEHLNLGVLNADLKLKLCSWN